MPLLTGSQRMPNLLAAIRIVVAGWSAGGNLAAVVCQLALAQNGSAIKGQLLVNPVTDSDFSRPSYSDNAEGYILTHSLMEWFWNHDCDVADRSDPRASPLQAESLAGLPPACVVTAELDPCGTKVMPARQRWRLPVCRFSICGLPDRFIRRGWQSTPS